MHVLSTACLKVLEHIIIRSKHAVCAVTSRMSLGMLAVRMSDWDCKQVTRIVLPGMKERKRGAIVNIGSAAATVAPSGPLYAVYAGTKVTCSHLFISSCNDQPSLCFWAILGTLCSDGGCQPCSGACACLPCRIQQSPSVQVAAVSASAVCTRHMWICSASLCTWSIAHMASACKTRRLHMWLPRCPKSGVQGSMHLPLPNGSLLPSSTLAMSQPLAHTGEPVPVLARHACARPRSMVPAACWCDTKVPAACKASPSCILTQTAFLGLFAAHLLEIPF